jgi:hypothetical protein
MRKCITLGCGCPDDAMFGVSIDDKEDRRRLRVPRIFSKAFFREMDVDIIDFEPKVEFFLLELLLAILSRDSFSGDTSRKVRVVANWQREDQSSGMARLLERRTM